MRAFSDTIPEKIKKVASFPPTLLSSLAHGRGNKPRSTYSGDSCRWTHCDNPTAGLRDSTRAKKKLYLIYSATKVYYGKQRPVIPCPFLYEIPEQFLDGKIGEQQKQDKQEYMDAFLAEMKVKLSGNL